MSTTHHVDYRDDEGRILGLDCHILHLDHVGEPLLQGAVHQESRVTRKRENGTPLSLEPPQ